MREPMVGTDDPLLAKLKRETRPRSPRSWRTSRRGCSISRARSRRPRPWPRTSCRRPGWRSSADYTPSKARFPEDLDLQHPGPSRARTMASATPGNAPGRRRSRAEVESGCPAGTEGTLGRDADSLGGGGSGYHQSQEALVVLQAALDDLPEKQRQVVLLRDVEGLPAGDVCNILALSETNVRVILHRGRAKLRQALDRTCGTGRNHPSPRDALWDGDPMNCYEAIDLMGDGSREPFRRRRGGVRRASRRVPGLPRVPRPATVHRSRPGSPAPPPGLQRVDLGALAAFRNRPR